MSKNDSSVAAASASIDFNQLVVQAAPYKHKKGCLDSKRIRTNAIYLTVTAIGSGNSGS